MDLLRAHEIFGGAGDAGGVNGELDGSVETSKRLRSMNSEIAGAVREAEAAGVREWVRGMAAVLLVMGEVGMSC